MAFGFEDLTGAESGLTDELDATSGTVSASDTDPITDGYSYIVTGNASYFDTGSSVGGLAGGYRLRFSVATIPSSGTEILCQMNTVTDDYKVTLDSSGVLKLQVASGTAVTIATISTDTIYLLQVSARGASPTGYMKASLDEATAVSASGTISSNPTKHVRCRGTGSSGVVKYDDVLVGSVADENEFVVVGQIEALRPDGDSADSGEDEWEDELANAETYSAVNQDPLDETEYAIESSQADADHRQLWTLGTIASVGTINHVRIGIWTKRGSGSGTQHRIRSKVSTAENSADIGNETAAAYYIFDPTTQPSNQSELDSYQTGVWRNSGGREFYCYEQWVMVDYTPAADGAVVQDVIGQGMIPFAR